MTQRSKPFRARIRKSDHFIELGYFATNEECEAVKNEYYRISGEKIRRCVTASQVDGLSSEEYEKAHLSQLPARLILIIEAAKDDQVLTMSQLKRSMRRGLEYTHPNHRELAIIEAMRLPEMLGLVEKIEGANTLQTKWKKVAIRG